MEPFIDYLDGQATMDTQAWVDGFGKSHWQSVMGEIASGWASRASA